MSSANQSYKKNLNSADDKNIGAFNYFLNDKINENSDIYKQLYKKVDLNAVCIKETWAKGLDFFFIAEGEQIKIVEINEQEKWVKVEKDMKIGLFHLGDFFLQKKKK